MLLACCHTTVHLSLPLCLRLHLRQQLLQHLWRKSNACRSRTTAMAANMVVAVTWIRTSRLSLDLAASAWRSASHSA